MADLDILDCTLRDGGYYNRWDFPLDLARDYLAAMQEAGIKKVELGFRTGAANGYAGAFQFTSDDLIRSLEPRVDVGVMVDAKEFGEDAAGIEGLFQPVEESPVSFVRVATTHANLPRAAGVLQRLKGMGYTTALNLMQVATLGREKIVQVADIADENEVDWLYAADSFGGMNPDEVQATVRLLKENFPGTVGFHGHENLGLALANTLAAMDAGAGIVDATVAGMGRGAGNLRSELLLIYLRWKQSREQLDPAPLFQLVNGPFRELRQTFRWGSDLPYMLAGANNIHPMYPQRLMAPARFEPQRIMQVLSILHDDGGATSFQEPRLDEAITRSTHSEGTEEVDAENLAGDTFAGRPVLIVGSGPGTKRHLESVRWLLGRGDHHVIQCNPHPEIEADATVAVVNAHGLARAEEMPSGTRFLLGFDALGAEWKEALQEHALHRYPCRIGTEVAVEADGCTMPASVVSMYAILAALAGGGRELLLVGFDGYTQAGAVPTARQMEQQQEMERFFEALASSGILGRCDATIRAITPTTYPVQEDSIYRILAEAVR